MDKFKLGKSLSQIKNASQMIKYMRKTAKRSFWEFPNDIVKGKKKRKIRTNSEGIATLIQKRNKHTRPNIYIESNKRKTTKERKLMCFRIEISLCYRIRRNDT